MTDCPKIILSKAKGLIDTQCPKCRHIDIFPVNNIKVSCKNCSTKFEAEYDPNIFSVVAKRLIVLLRYNNSVLLQGECENKNVWTMEDLICKKAKFSEKVLYAMMEIRDTFKDHLCWDISEIEVTKDIDYRTSCKECGYCKTCVTCLDCKQTYVPKTVKTMNRVERRFTCPYCNSKRQQASYFKKPETKGTKEYCPYCKSEHIDHTKFESSRKDCYICGSTKINKPREMKVYRLKISRQTRFEINNGNTKC